MLPPLESPKYCVSFTTQIGRSRVNIHLQSEVCIHRVAPGSALSLPCCGGKEIRGWGRDAKVNEDGRSEEIEAEHYGKLFCNELRTKLEM